MELKRIHFIIVLSQSGKIIDIEEPQTPIQVVRSRQRGGRESQNTPNYMWDSLGYITAAPFQAMVSELTQKYPESLSIKAVKNFYHNNGLEQLQAHPMWQKISAQKGHNITFRLVGEQKTAAQQPELINPIKNKIAQSHPKIYISGAAGTGARLVSYGKSLGYESYGLKGGENASVSIDVAEGYTTAITALRQMNGEGNIVIGEVTFLHFDHTIIALLPNAGRVSVRLFLQECDTARLESRELLSYIMTLAPKGDPKRLAPQFIVDFVEAFVTDQPLPKQTLQRILSNRNLTFTQLDILHKYLNINDMALNREFANIGYLLGRMLAIVEHAQTTSQHTLTYTIKDQTYATLSVTPAALFNRVIVLSASYFRRIQSRGTQIYLKMQLAEVVDKIVAEGVPARLSLEDQGRFAIGYHHQNQELFRNKSEHDS